MQYISLIQVENLIKNVFDSFPKETSGVIIGNKNDNLLNFIDTGDQLNTINSFVIRKTNIECINRYYLKPFEEILGYYHSHILGDAFPSRNDINQKKENGELWLIYSVRCNNLNLYRWEDDCFRKEKFRIIK